MLARCLSASWPAGGLGQLPDMLGTRCLRASSRGHLQAVGSLPTVASLLGAGQHGGERAAARSQSGGTLGRLAMCAAEEEERRHPGEESGSALRFDRLKRAFLSCSTSQDGNELQRAKTLKFTVDCQQPAEDTIIEPKDFPAVDVSARIVPTFGIGSGF